jgi:hypothetical protein
LGGGNGGLFFGIGPHFSSTLTFTTSRIFFYLPKGLSLYMANNSRQPESFPNEFHGAIFSSPGPAARKHPFRRAAKKPAIRSARLGVSFQRVREAKIGVEQGRGSGTGFAAVIRNLKYDP